MLGLVLGMLWHGDSASSKAHAQAAPMIATNQEVAALQAEVTRLKGIVPDQSHAMADVGYHFANLWFAGEKKNWPLAGFYCDETRAHLKWAVRIIPMRKDPAGQPVDLKAILEAVDGSLLAEVKKSIDSKDREKFVATYKQALEGCYACHKASGKPYLHPQIPLTPPQTIISFEPEPK